MRLVDRPPPFIMFVCALWPERVMRFACCCVCVWKDDLVCLGLSPSPSYSDLRDLLVGLSRYVLIFCFRLTLEGNLDLYHLKGRVLSWREWGSAAMADCVCSCGKVAGKRSHKDENIYAVLQFILLSVTLS